MRNDWKKGRQFRRLGRRPRETARLPDVRLEDDLDDTRPNCHTPLTAAHKPLDPMHRAREAAAGAERAQAFNDWNDGQPGTELNFKFYRQATNKIAGISDEAAAFLGEFF
jgi:hypothetical protein